MSDETKSIDDIDFKLLVQYFSQLERQGPGNPETTRKALSFIDNLTESSKIADIGCGTGGQTETLAHHTSGYITGIDLFPKFIDIFNNNIEKFNLQNRVQGVVGSMDNLPFQEEELDLIWSEGAIYNIGFEQGLKEWKRFLKPGGYIAVSEASWFTESRPDEINDFWNSEYPEIGTMPVKLAQLQDAGYIPVASFKIPNECWTTHYYEPQVSLQENFLKEHAGNKPAEEFIASMKHEALMYEKYNQYYGYVFYIGKKI